MMYNKFFKRSMCVMPLNIQFFADGDGAGADDGNGGGSGGDVGADDAGTDGDNNDGNNQLPNFDDFLKEAGNQAEFDRRLQKAIDTTTTKLKSDFDLMLNDQLTEAEKLTKMTDDQKAEYQLKKQNAALAKREADITRRELTATAKVSLADKGLPVELADVLNYQDAESCNKSIDVVEKAFQKAVSAAVEEKLKGSETPKRAPGNVNNLEEQVANAIKGNF